MAAFTIKWDDFTGGYFVGENDSKQPRNTFTGQNVNITTHDGSVVPINAITHVQTVTQDFAGEEDPYVTMTVQDGSLHLESSASSPLLTVSQPVQSGNSLFFAVQSRDSFDIKLWLFQLVFTDALNPENGGTLYRSSSITISGISNNLISNVVATKEAANTTYAYFAFLNKIYRFSCSGFSSPTLSSTITTSFSTNQPIGGLTIWNARMIAWSQATDTFYFSNALDFATWPSLNFLAPGYSNNGILFCAPRWNDLLVVKPNSVFSVTGVLGDNSVVRQVSDGLYPADVDYGAMTANNNALFFISSELSPYSTNIYVLAGQEHQIAAYQNFGRYVLDDFGFDYTTQPSMFALGNGDIGVVYPKNFTGIDGFYALIRDKNGKFIRIMNDSLSFYAPVTNPNNFIRRVSIASSSTSPGSDSWYGNFGFPSNALVIMQVATNGEYSSGTGRMWIPEKSISFGILRKNQLNAGTEYGGSGITGWEDFPEVTSGTLTLSPIETETLSKVTRIYIEAALELDQANWNDFVGDAYMNVYVTNQAVDDIEFSPTPSFVSTVSQFDVDLTDIPDTSSYNYLTPGEFPSEPFGSNNPDKRLTTTRIVRFDSNNSGYGYKHNISIDFAGFRIKRVWAEGTTR